MNFNKPILLASTSPRRQFLMKEIGFQFQTTKPDGDESFSHQMPVANVPSYLATKKASSLKSIINDEIVVSSDTVVILDGKILNKPADRREAIQMLSDLSGQTHTVITAVCLLSKKKMDLFDDRTEVTFKKVSLKEIEHYIDHYKPFDKAGSYGAQECLPAGINPCSPKEIEFLKSINKIELIEKSINRTSTGAMACIEKIDGAYFTVMGLPIHKVYQHLIGF